VEVARWCENPNVSRVLRHSDLYPGLMVFQTKFLGQTSRLNLPAGRASSKDDVASQV